MKKAKKFLIKNITRYISDADAAAAEKAVEEVRAELPDATVEEVVDQLIRRKCRQAGAVGAVTSGAAVIPGLGTITAMTFGVAADIGMTFKLQAELVLEIAFAYEKTLDEEEKHTIILTITGISAGSQAAIQKAGQQVATKASAYLAHQAFTKAIPFLGVAASGGTNIVTTYIIGRRAQAYFSLGPEEMGNWKDGLRAVSGVNEQEIVRWLGETTEQSWSMMSTGAQAATDTVIVAGKSTGTAIMVYSKRTTDAVVASGGRLIGAITGGAAYLWPFSTSEDEDDSASIASDIVTEQEEEPAATGSLWQRLTSRFSRSEADNEDQLEIDEETLVEQMVEAEIEGATVVGIVGAGDDFLDGPTEQGYLQRVTGLFAWRPEGWQSGSTRENNDEEADEALLSEFEPPSTLIVVDSAEPDEEHQEGLTSRVFKMFTWRSTGDALPEELEELALSPEDDYIE